MGTCAHTWTDKDCPARALCVPLHEHNKCACEFSEFMFVTRANTRCVPSVATKGFGLCWACLGVCAVFVAWRVVGTMAHAAATHALAPDVLAVTAVLCVVTLVLFSANCAVTTTRAWWFEDDPETDKAVSRALEAWSSVLLGLTTTFYVATLMCFAWSLIVVLNAGQNFLRNVQRRTSWKSAASVLAVGLSLCVVVAPLWYGQFALADLVASWYFVGVCILFNHVSHRATAVASSMQTRDVSSDILVAMHGATSPVVYACVGLILATCINAALWLFGRKKLNVVALGPGCALSAICQFCFMLLALFMVGKHLSMRLWSRVQTRRTSSQVIVSNPEELHPFGHVSNANSISDGRADEDSDLDSDMIEFESIPPPPPPRLPHIPLDNLPLPRQPTPQITPQFAPRLPHVHLDNLPLPPPPPPPPPPRPAALTRSLPPPMTRQSTSSSVADIAIVISDGEDVDDSTVSESDGNDDAGQITASAPPLPRTRTH